MKYTTLCTLALTFMVVICGCQSVPPTMYTLSQTTVDPMVSTQANSLRVLLASDLRAYTIAPLYFHLDGSVTEYRPLTFYTSLDVVIQKFLSEHTTFKGEKGQFVIVLDKFCIQEYDTGSKIVVAMHVKGRASTQTQLELPQRYSPEDVRTTLIKALLDVYTSISK